MLEMSDEFPREQFETILFITLEHLQKTLSLNHPNVSERLEKITHSHKDGLVLREMFAFIILLEGIIQIYHIVRHCVLCWDFFTSSTICLTLV